MQSSAPPRNSVRPGGGKEELRAAVLKPYFLRLRAEKGERMVSAIAEECGLEAAALENETMWISAERAKRVLKALVHELGPEALKHRGQFAAHPEAVGSYVRLLRTSKSPLDGYRYLSKNAKEETRIGEWELEEGATPNVLKMTYRPREPSEEEDLAGELLLCASRIGELAAVPLFWGEGEPRIDHPSCLGRGGPSCVYDITLGPVGTPPRDRWLMTAGAAIVAGLLFGLIGGIVVGVLASALGAALGWGFGYVRERKGLEERARTFEKNRIAALERSLELKGDTSNAPGDLGGNVLGGKYKIGRKIGSGGIGVVYAAEHVTLGHEVAVKVLRGAAARDGSEIARLRREAHVQVHVDHPNIARVLDLDQMPDGSIYVVMERLVGRSLADKLGKDGLIAPGFAIPCFIGVCSALAAAHQKGVVHRDLKPGNIFLCDDGMSKVLDFGMSKLTSAESLTQAGYTLGTPEYMAPEQCIGAAVEARTDLYALGVLMYEALTGELPISSPSRRELLDLHQRQTPMSMRTRRPDLPIPEALDAAVMKCLRKKPYDRPASAHELESMLAAIPLDGLPLYYSANVARKRTPRARTA